MSRVHANALCVECEEPFRWLEFTPRICPECRLKIQNEAASKPEKILAIKHALIPSSQHSP